MSTRKLPIDQLQPGMLLAQPILDDSGRTVVPEGSRLTPMHIKRLNKWGIETVIITDDESSAGLRVGTSEEQSATGGINPEEHERMRRVAGAVAMRFSDIHDNPIMDELKRLAVRHLVLSSQNGDIPGLDTE